MSASAVERLPFDAELTRTFRADVRDAFDLEDEPDIDTVSAIDNPYSRVYRVSISCGKERRVVYLKQRRIRSPDRAERVRDRLRAEHDVTARLASDPPCGYAVIVPIAFYPSVPVLVTRAAEGPTLNALYRYALRFPHALMGGRNHIESAVADCGRWLRDSHQATMVGDQPFDTDDLLDYAEARLTLLGRRDSVIQAPALFASFRSALQARAAEIPVTRVAGRHNDFASHNIVCPTGEVRVLDFGMYDHGSVAYDACRFWMELEFLSCDPLYSRRAIRRAQDIFIGAYGLVDPADPVFEIARTRYVLNALLSAADRKVEGWVTTRYRRRLVKECLAWIQEFTGSDPA